VRTGSYSVYNHPTLTPITKLWYNTNIIKSKQALQCNITCPHPRLDDLSPQQNSFRSDQCLRHAISCKHLTHQLADAWVYDATATCVLRHRQHPTKKLPTRWEQILCHSDGLYSRSHHVYNKLATNFNENNMCNCVAKQKLLLDLSLNSYHFFHVSSSSSFIHHVCWFSSVVHQATLNNSNVT